MNYYSSIARKIGFYFFAVMVLAACSPSPTPIATSELPAPIQASPTAAPVLSVTPAAAATSIQVPTASAADSGSAVVAFVKDGNIQVWEEATGQSETIFDAGDAIDVTLSDDGQVIAFLRRSVIQKSELEWYEQSALWAMERNGENPRELVSAEALRALLAAEENESTNIPQMEWIPGTHRLLYNGWTYIVQAEGESHAIPQGLFQVDADTLTQLTLVPAGKDLRFSPSPDGGQVALLSPTSLSFIASDGSDLRQDVLTFPATGVPGPYFPSGVWAQDARAFLMAGSFEMSPRVNINFTIWRVPVDGSQAVSLATVSDSIGDSVTFAPNGRQAAFFRGAEQDGWLVDSAWFVTPLAVDAGPLAIPRSMDMLWKNLHWSPAGEAYTVNERTLFQLCPDAAQNGEVCSKVLELGGDLSTFQWIDGTRFLFVTRDPYDLYFGKLDGTRILLAEGTEKFASVAKTCQNDAQLVAGGESPGEIPVAPETLFRTMWRIQNTGTCTWDPSYRQTFLSGERLSGPRSIPLGGTVPPGGEIELSVKLLAPAAAGTYQGQWQLFSPDGRPFGAIATIEIVVPSRESSVPHLDTLVSAASSGSSEDLVALMKFASLPCTTGDGLGGPPKCLAGEAEGTLVEVLPILGPEGHHIRRSEIGSWPGIGGAQLYAAYRVPESAYSDEFYPTGEYGVAFLMPDKVNVVVFQVTEEGIVRLDYHALPSFEEMLNASEVVLGPYPPPE